MLENRGKKGHCYIFRKANATVPSALFKSSIVLIAHYYCRLKKLSSHSIKAWMAACPASCPVVVAVVVAEVVAVAEVVG